MNSLVGLLGNVKEPNISTLQEILACLVSPEPCYPDLFRFHLPRHGCRVGVWESILILQYVNLMSTCLSKD